MKKRQIFLTEKSQTTYADILLYRRSTLTHLLPLESGLKYRNRVEGKVVTSHWRNLANAP